MSSRFLRNVVLSLMGPAFLLSPIIACQSDESEGTDETKPLVVASIFPVGDLARQVAGSGVRVEVLLPSGALPVTWEVTPRQLRDFRDALLFLMVGGGLDEWVTEIADASGGDPTVVRLTEGISLLAADPDHEHGTGNPHIWLDPILVRDRLLPKVEESLVAVMPLAEETIRANAIAFSDSLTALDREIREAFEGLERRSFVATHAAWSYFAARYGLEEVGVVHPKPGHEPASRELANLLELAGEREVHCVFTEPQMGEAAARALTTELDLPSCTLDPLGGARVEDRDSYLALLRFNTRMFLQGLRAQESKDGREGPEGRKP